MFEKLDFHLLQLKICRNFLCGYLFIYFIYIFIDLPELFFGKTANEIFLLEFLLILAALCCLSVMRGFFYKTSLMIIWLSYYYFFSSNPLTRELHHQFISLLLIIFMLLPFENIPGEDEMKFFRKAQFFLLGLVSLNYTISGLSKLFYEGWLDGRVGLWLAEFFILRPSMLPVYSKLSQNYSTLICWTVLAIEISSFGLFLILRLRKVCWGAGIFLQILILLFMQLGQISLIMITIYFLTFDLRWLRRSEPLLAHK